MMEIGIYNKLSKDEFIRGRRRRDSMVVGFTTTYAISAYHICLNIDHYFHNSINRFCGLVLFMVFYTTFNNISVILWRSVLLVEETRVPGENHRPVASH
jgi:hypothetical protein